MRAHRVRALLMGGQACVLYGGAEFSRDADFVVLASAENLSRLAAALKELQARTIAVPSFALKNLKRGLAVHFRCQHPDARGLRVDVMSVLRGVEPFAKLWKRRTTLSTPAGERYDLLALPDLVQAKKTQREKDWGMIRRLLEANHFQFRAKPTAKQIAFWLRELRTAELLIEVARKHPTVLKKELAARPLLQLAAQGGEAELATALEAEQKREQALDRSYWTPLKVELGKLRRTRIRTMRGLVRGMDATINREGDREI